MDLSRIRIQPRIRNTWEAIDLGFIMTKSWWWPLFLSWLIPSALVYIVLSCIFIDNNWIAILITWWLKPLWDRAPLYIASRNLFNDYVTIPEALKILPKLYSKDIIAWLTWRRLSLTRSFDMPITVLESLKHKARSNRINTLHHDTSNAATWLTMVCIHMEIIITFGIIAFIMILIPEEIDINVMNLIIDGNIIATFVSNIVSFLSMAVIAPFYTVAGFALYINRRIKLEAWDIEIRFRHLAEKQRNIKAIAPALSFFILFLCTSSIFYPNYSHAEDQLNLTPESSKTIIAEVLQGPDFHNVVAQKGWRLKGIDNNDVENDNIPSWIISIIKFLESWLGDEADNENDKTSNNYYIAILIEALLWFCASLLIAYVAYRLTKYFNIIDIPFRKEKSINKEPAPNVLFGLDIRTDSIPKNVESQTLSLWNNGKHREAICLLYRSTLSLLIHQFSYQFNDGNTEQECANIVSKSNNKQLSEFVIQITNLWQNIAYAHITPPYQQVQRLSNMWPVISNYEK